jgi:predicted DNA-binding transcriptional regulator YafY
MDAVEPLDSVSDVPDDFDLTVFADRSFGVFQEPLEDIVLRVSPAASARAVSYRFHPSQTLEPQDDGGLIVRLRAGGLLELCWHLFTWRGEIEILGPDSLKAMMAEELARFRL